MTDEKFLRGCVFLKLSSSNQCEFLSLGLVCGSFAFLCQDVGVCLTSLMLLSISVGLKHAFPSPFVWSPETY